MKRIAWITALILGTMATLVLLWQFRQALLVFLLSLATAAAVRPIILKLIKRGIKPGIALALTYLALLLLIGGLFVIISRSLLTDLEQLTNNLTAGYENILQTWPTSGDQIQEAIVGRLPPADKLFSALSGTEGQQVLQGILGSASGLAGFLGQSVIIIILSIYWSADRVHFERLWLSIIPVEQRTKARAAWQAIETGVGDYINGEIVQSYLVVVILWVGFTWIGLPYPALLAILSALAWFIPWLGAVIAIFPVIMIGLTVSPGIALGAGLLTMATLAMMELTIQPRFFARQRFNSLLLVLAVIMMAQVSGILGVILAPVLVAALQIGFQHLMAAREIELHAEQVGEEFAQLKASLENLQERLRAQDQEATPEVLSLMERMEGLVVKTTQYLQSTSYLKPPKKRKITPATSEEPIKGTDPG